MNQATKADLIESLRESLAILVDEANYSSKIRLSTDLVGSTYYRGKSDGLLVALTKVDQIIKEAE